MKRIFTKYNVILGSTLAKFYVILGILCSMDLRQRVERKAAELLCHKLA